MKKKSSQKHPVIIKNKKKQDTEPKQKNINSKKKNKEIEDPDHPHEYKSPKVLKKQDDQITNVGNQITNAEEKIIKD